MATEYMQFGEQFAPIYIILSILVLALNTAEAVMIIKRRRVINSFEIILLHLSMAGLLTGFVSIYLAIFIISSKTDQPDFEKHYTVVISTTLALQCTMVFVFAVSVDRLVAVKYPFWHRSKVTNTRAKKFAGVAWVVSLCSSAILIAIYGLLHAQDSYILHKPYRVVEASLIFVVDGIFALINLEIVRVIINQRQAAKKLVARRAGSNSRERDVSLIIANTLVVVSFLVCTIPRSITLLLYRSKSTAHVGLMSNAAMNPIIYFFKGYLERFMKKRRIRSNRSNATKTTDVPEQGPCQSLDGKKIVNEEINGIRTGDTML